MGEVGQNFAAGMSGGVAYVYDRFRTLASRCNTELVELLTPDEDDFELIHALLEEHVERTQSLVVSSCSSNSAQYVGAL